MKKAQGFILHCLKRTFFEISIQYKLHWNWKHDCAFICKINQKREKTANVRVPWEIQRGRTKMSTKKILKQVFHIISKSVFKTKYLVMHKNILPPLLMVIILCPSDLTHFVFQHPKYSVPTAETYFQAQARQNAFERFQNDRNLGA